MKFKKHVTSPLLVLLIAAFALSSCKNSVSDDHDDHHHHDAEGFRLLINNEVVVDKLPNESIDNNFPQLISSEESDVIDVWFYTFDGELFQPDEDDHLSLAVEVEDAQHLEPRISSESWSFSLLPKASGSTSFTILLMHGDHDDFTSVPVSVTINDTDN